jgi:hypothetical protein
MTGQRHLLYVLALAEAAFAILAALGETVSMGGNGLYALWGLAVATLYVAAGARGAAGRRWALVTLIAAESVRLVGVLLSVALGLMPFVQATFTGTSVVTSIALPIAVVWMSAVLLRPGPVTAPPPRVGPPVPLSRTLAMPTATVSPSWTDGYLEVTR